MEHTHSHNSHSPHVEPARLVLQVAIALAVVLGILAVGLRLLGRTADPGSMSPQVLSASAAEAHPSFLYGRVTTVEGSTYEGRLRFGGDEEAVWGHYFNGFKKTNPWADQVPPERLLRSRRSVPVFGLRLSRGERTVNLGRPFMARFGDIARIDAIGEGVRAALARGIDYAPELRVTLKSGAVYDLDRFSADDFADGVRVWDASHGVVDLPERRIRSIAFLSPAEQSDVADRLYGTVHTREGTFIGFVQWDRELSLGSDLLRGETADGPVELPFTDIRAISRRAAGGAFVTMHDGREIAFSDIRRPGYGHRGLYVDDPRYGRVLISWDAFEHVDFSEGGHGPVYDDFPAGGPLMGRVTTRTGRRLVGRLVYDLDESEVIETLDAPAGGVDYTIPFGLVASIEPVFGKDRARLTLHSGEKLLLERAGDLGDGNAGLLVFVKGQQQPEYVPWDDVERVDLDRPKAMYPSVQNISTGPSDVTSLDP